MEDFDYQKIYEMITNMNKSTKEKCLICHFVIEEKEIELKCTHQYHTKCIEPKKNGTVICPYCGKTNKLAIESNSNQNMCHFKMLSGKRKGLECNRVNCGYHKKDGIACESIIKSGIKKGELCGRLNCKYHGINL